MATIIDGKAIAKQIRADLKQRAAALQADGITPTLATVLVGDNPESATYVRMKHRACARVGIATVDHVLGNETTQAELEAVVQQLNDDPAVHGILVQLPLLDGMDDNRIIDRIAPEKDVDGFGIINMGLLAQRRRQPHFVPATPAGIMVLLAETGVDLTGKHAVVIGRSNIVGMPIALLLKEADATVTIAHRHTADLVSHVQMADVLIVAAGQPAFITGDMLKPGCVVIDVGINYLDDATAAKGYRIVGDVEWDTAEPVAGFITPVPGGVGPMTITMLMHNVLVAAG